MSELLKELSTEELTLFLSLVDCPELYFSVATQNCFIKKKSPNILYINCVSASLFTVLFEQRDYLAKATASLNLAAEIHILIAGQLLRKIPLKSKDFEKLTSLKQGDFTMSIHDKNLQLPSFQTNIPGVGEVTFPEFFQFLSEEARQGRFWMIFENSSHRCLFLTDNAEPGRLVVSASQYIGKNRRDAWRDTMDDYERLQHLLVTEKVAPSFETDCYRLDGSFAHIQKTYYLIEGLFGTQCRASCSEGWELLRPTPDTN